MAIMPNNGHQKLCKSTLWCGLVFLNECFGGANLLQLKCHIMHIKNAYSFDYNNFLLYSPINEISEEKTETAPLLKAVGSG